MVFGGELLLHWSIVTSLLTEKDLALEGGWIVFGGWRFVLDTAKMQPLLLIAPPWVTAIILPLALFGLAGWRGPLGSRVAATVGIYILAFSFVGRPFNRYWGLMYTLDYASWVVLCLLCLERSLGNNTQERSKRLKEN